MPVVDAKAVRLARVAAPVAVLGLAAALRFWALGQPGTLVFDELYYVRDAVSQLAHGFPTTWPDDEPEFGGERARAFSNEASTIAHPPLGKWLIAIGIVLFGADTGWGWRFAVALAGVASIGIVMRLGWLISGSHVVASLAGFLLAIDGVHVVLTRVALLDGFLAALIALGALFMWHDLRSTPEKLWRRPWLIAAGLTFGAAAAVKWSGLYALAAYLLLSVAIVAVRHWRAGRRRAVRATAAHVFATGLIALPAAAAAYVASWAGWIAQPTAQNRDPGTPWWVSFGEWHAEALRWHSTLSAPHPYASHPLTWPLGLRPTAMYSVSWGTEEGCTWPGGCVSVISPVPNVLVTWGGVAAILLLGWVALRWGWIALRRREPSLLTQPALGGAVFVLVGYLSGWLPWVLTTSRSAVFQFYAVVLTPFAALALALVLGAVVAKRSSSTVLALAGVRFDDSADALLGRRLAVTIALALALVVAVLFFPLWAGLPVPDWFWRAHLWLPGWV